MDTATKSNQHPPGYNPIWHECDRHGCYLVERNPKTEWFASCFRGKISISDMDKIVEVNGRALVLEWKGTGGVLRTAQIIMWERLTRGRMFTVMAVNGNPKTMEVDSYRWCRDGQWDKDWTPGGMLDLQEQFTKWNDWAEKNPVSHAWAGR